MDKPTFAETFAALVDHSPMPWQTKLYERFAKANTEIPSHCDIPTGLGKTSVIAIWLIALAHERSEMPRRLVYVVNRRTVVDQTTDEVERLRRHLDTKPELETLRDRLGGLALSTLRGQFADNQEWSADPSRPAVICGTVDMIGSRLLFSGYRIGYKSKPLHAAFLGQDALLVHDEAHLEPAFQRLIETIESEQRRDTNDETGTATWPALRVMALSATGRRTQDSSGTTFELTANERNLPSTIPDPPTEPIHVVWKRLKANKTLHLVPIESDNKELVNAIIREATSHATSGRAVLVFARTVKAVDDVARKLPDGATRMLTGTLRGWERDNDLVKSPVFQRFLPASNRDPKTTPAEGTVYLVCTSAGEVGVNISADHLVCDLSTFDSMAQRFGRVNRFGDCHDTQIHVIHPTSFEKKGKTSEFDERRHKTLELLRQLAGDASPHALGQLDMEARNAAFAPEPTILPTSDILLDAWSLTTIREQIPGRPPVAPYLHGVTEWDPPQTEVAWRHEVEIVDGDLVDRYPPKDLLEDYPLKPHELLKDSSERVFKALGDIAKRCPCVPVWLVSDDGSVDPLPIENLADKTAKELINGRTVLLPESVGGLSNGLLNGNARFDENVDYYVDDRWTNEQGQQIRTRVWDSAEPPEQMSLIRTIDAAPDTGEFDVESTLGAPTGGRRLWHWYVRPRNSEDITRASARPVRLEHHTRDVVARTCEIVSSLQLHDELQQALVLAAELHDLGKRRELWQRGIGNPNPSEWFAKPGKPKDGKRWRPRRISNYRHEFGSLLDILDPNQDFQTRFEQLSESMRELVLHVIAAHHGRARPHFPTGEAFDPHPGTNDRARDQALETARRFARLQRKYGRWGLAYLESLLRAADWSASAKPSEAMEENA